MGDVTHSNLEDVFTYHKPKGDFQIEKYHRLRQGARFAAQMVLDTDDPARRHSAIDEFRRLLTVEVGDCRDRNEALGLLEAADGFVGGLAKILAQTAGATDVEAAAEGTQAIIAAIRAAVMWANASVALEGRI